MSAIQASRTTMSLLDIARASARQHRLRVGIVDGELELYLAWLRGDVTTLQVSRALDQSTKKGSGNVLYRIATAMRNGIAQGQLEIVLKR